MAGLAASNRIPGVLTIYLGKPEIPVGKLNGSRHSVWGASENMGCDLRLFNSFLPVFVCSTDLVLLRNGSFSH